MRFKPTARPVRWTDRTLSVLRASRLEACEKELAGLGGLALFDPEASDADAERLFSQSYYAEERKEVRLHTLEELRLQVLSQMPAEIGLLSEEEFPLAVKLALFGGEIPLNDWNDLLPARSLVRRMWCRMRPEKGLWLYMPRQLCLAALLMLGNEEMKKVREVAVEVTETVDSTLYLAGMMSSETVIRDMGFRLQGSMAADRPDLYRRMLKASFETVLNRDGRLMLVHPGLAEPGHGFQGETAFSAGLDQNSLDDLYGSLTEVEDPLYDRLLSLIQDLGRPETNPEDTVEDLILLAKQGAPVEEMRQVLGSKIICLPTGEMTEVLRDMHDRIPRWFTLNMERVQ